MKKLSLWIILFGAFFLCNKINSQNGYVKRINCGAPNSDTINFNGEDFESDETTTGFTTTADLKYHTLTYAGVSEPLKSFAFTKNATMDYNFSVPNGMYRVLLHFVEPYHGPAPGTDGSFRVFDVDIESGQYNKTNLNIWSEAGSIAGGLYTIDTQVTVSDGTLTIAFSKVQNDPIINAIEVLGLPSPTNSAPVANAGSDIAITLPTNNTTLVGNGIDSDGTIVDYQWSQLSGPSTASLSGANSALLYSSDLIEGTYVFRLTVTDDDGATGFDDTSIVVRASTTGGNSENSVWTEFNSTASYTGNVAIGRSSAPNGYRLAVEGNVRAREIRVDNDSWPDYVFTKDYDLPSLEEVQNHIQEKGHLPNIPSAKEVEENGVELGEMDKLLLEKVEQLTLYILQQQKEIDLLKKELKK